MIKSMQDGELKAGKAEGGSKFTRQADRFPTSQLHGVITMERLVPLVAKLQEVLGIVGKLHLGQVRLTFANALREGEAQSVNTSSSSPSSGLARLLVLAGIAVWHRCMHKRCFSRSTLHPAQRSPH